MKFEPEFFTKLELSQIKHYCQIVTAIEETIEIQKAIDKLYPQVEENVVEFNPATL